MERIKAVIREYYVLRAATCGSLGVLYDEDGRDSFITSGKANDAGRGDDSCGARGFGIVMNGKGRN